MVFLSSNRLLNRSALTCSPFFSRSYSCSFSPSATILSLIFIFNFKKDSSSCSTAIFKRTLFRKVISSIKFLSFSIFFDGKESCALIPSEATNILPSTSNLFNSTNKKFLNMSKFLIKWYL